jgi:predicted RNase H-like HicB family nuclease
LVSKQGVDNEPADSLRANSQPESDDDEPLPKSASLDQALELYLSDKSRDIMNYQVPIMIERLEEGGFYAECTVLLGCHVEGSTYLEALEYLEDAIRIHIEGRLEFGQPLPPELVLIQQPKPFSLQ